MNTFILSMLSMVGLGIFFAAVLAVANRWLKVEEDPRSERIEGLLPGLNCGACGFPNCRALAEAIAKGDETVTSCSVGGEAAAKSIAKFLGVEAKKTAEKIAVVHCGADASVRTKKAKYVGIDTCTAANMIYSGGLNCRSGCLGFGDCAEVCPVGAIEMINGLPKVDPDKCTACGKCVKACPRNIISLEPFEKKTLTFVACNSTDKGAFVKRICPVGCIGCMVCKKLTEGVFEVVDNLAKVDYKKATSQTNWDLAREKCPTHTIQRI